MPVLTVQRAPTSRSVEAGRWPIAMARSQSGVTTKRLFGNLASGLTLSLSYDNVPDDIAEDFLRSYQLTKGGLDYLETAYDLGIQSTDLMFAGMSRDMTNEILSASTGARWTYREPPAIQSVAPNISTVKIVLIAELRSD